MLFDPDDGKTREEIIDTVLDRMGPEMRARCERLSEISGLSLVEIVEKTRILFEESLDDPATRAALKAKVNRQLQPYGRDPLLPRQTDWDLDESTDDDADE